MSLGDLNNEGQNDISSSESHSTEALKQNTNGFEDGINNPWMNNSDTGKDTIDSTGEIVTEKDETVDGVYVEKSDQSDLPSQVNQEASTQQKRSDVYFKIWGRLETKTKLSNLGCAKIKPVEVQELGNKNTSSKELERYVKEYSEQTVVLTQTVDSNDKTSKKANVLGKKTKKNLQQLAKGSSNVEDELPDPKDDLER